MKLINSYEEKKLCVARERQPNLWINVGELQGTELSKRTKTEEQNLQQPTRRKEAKSHPAAHETEEFQA